MLLEMFVIPSVGGKRLETVCLAELARDVDHGWSGTDWLLLLEGLFDQGHAEVRGMRFERLVTQERLQN